MQDHADAESSHNSAHDDELAAWSGGCLAPLAHLLPPASRCRIPDASAADAAALSPEPECILQSGQPQHRLRGAGAQALEAHLAAELAAIAAVQRAREDLQQLGSTAGGDYTAGSDREQRRGGSWVHVVPLNEHCSQDRLPPALRPRVGPVALRFHAEA